MEEKRPIDIARKVQELLEASRIIEALKLLDELVTASADWQIREEYEQLSTNYRLLLQYMSQGVMDPARHSVLSRLTQSLLTLTWRSYNAVVQPSSHELFFTRRLELADTPLSRMAENYRTELNKYALLKSVPSESQDKTAVLMTLRRREALETDIFNKLWSSYPTSGDDAEVASNLLTGDAWPSDEIDENPDRYIQFGIKPNIGTTLKINNISLFVCGCGGNGMCSHIYHSTDNFATRTTIFEMKKMPANNMQDVTVTPVISLEEGQELLLRIYPWYNGAATGKTICLSDVTISGIAMGATNVNGVRDGGQSEVDSIRYFTPDGREQACLSRGLNIIRRQFTDGTVMVSKVME